MYMKTTWIIFTHLILFAFLCTPLSAQQWNTALKHAGKNVLKAAKQYNGNINKAVRESISRANAVNKAFKPVSRYNNTFTNNFILLKKSYGTTAYADGWKLNENREWLIQRIVYERTRQELFKNKNKFPAFLKQQPVMEPHQLAKLIPTDKKYVFMGEYHENYLSLKIQQTVVEYSRLHPEKTIIVFSEFAHEEMTPQDLNEYTANILFSQYMKNDIPWVGLEEVVPQEILLVAEDLRWPPQASLTGIKARNEHWIAKLKEYRQKYPDAVFFIHSGSLHSGYQEPFSVSTAFKPQESFVMQFIPLVGNLPDYPLNTEKFHIVTRAKYLRPGTLIWTNKEFARMTGFDVQVILPLEEKWYSLVK